MISDLEQLDQVVQALPVSGPLHFIDAGQQVERVRRGQVVPELGFLAEDGADLVGQAGALAPRDFAQHEGLAGGGVEDADQHLDGGGLAGAVGTDEGDPLSFLHGEGDVFHGQGLAAEWAEESAQASAQAGSFLAGDEGFGQSFHLDGGHGCLLASFWVSRASSYPCLAGLLQIIAGWLCCTSVGRAQARPKRGRREAIAATRSLPGHMAAYFLCSGR